MNEDRIFSLVGETGFSRLVAAFYRQVHGDDILGPMYPAHDLEGAEQRLRDFLIYRFGRPTALHRTARTPTVAGKAHSVPS